MEQKRIRKPSGYWNIKENCKNAASECKKQVEFKTKYSAGYRISCLNNWLIEFFPKIDKNIEKEEKRKEKERLKLLNYNSKYLIYIAIWNNFNTIYIGLSKNFKIRKKQHENLNSNDVVPKFIKSTGIFPTWNILHENLTIDDACLLEKQYIKNYRNNNEYIVLNINDGGGYGGSILKWTKEECVKEALKYTTRIEFKRKSSVAYSIACRNGWYKEICSHMIETRKPNNYWNYDHCKEEALKYTTRIEFKKKSSGAYKSAFKHGWLDDICSHMEELLKPDGYWTKKMCADAASKCNSRTIFQKNYGGAYNVSRDNGWLDEFFPKNKQK